MASIKKRGKVYRVQVKVGGRRKTKTLPTLSEARKWASDTETDLRRNSHQAVNKSFGDLLRRYECEVSNKKKGARWESVRIRAICERDPLSSVNLQYINSADIAAWRDRRLRSVSGSSVAREWNLLRHAITVAIREWRWLVDNPMEGVARPKENKPRSRRPADEELQQLSVAFGYSDNIPPATKSQRTGAAMWFAIETAMRAGEIARLRRSNIVGRVAQVRDTKNGSDRDVPLSPRAMEIIDTLGDDLFELSSSQITSLFRKAKARAGVEGLTFHDMRGEATTRLSKKLDVLELARMTGHKDLKILLSTYYRATAEDIADKL